MNTKEIKITVPEGYEIDKENSTFECIKFKKKGLTYEDVAEKLFKGRKTYFLGTLAHIDYFIPEANGIYLANNASSEKQLQRLLAINKLMNVAEYLNDGWKPDWKDPLKSKWYILWDNCSNKFEIGYRNSYTSGPVYFKTPDLALQAIEILGEEEVKLALGV
jgi:hypothetical protein